jgi:hypothetical protein
MFWRFALLLCFLLSFQLLLNQQKFTKLNHQWQKLHTSSISTAIISSTLTENINESESESENEWDDEMDPFYTQNFKFNNEAFKKNKEQYLVFLIQKNITASIFRPPLFSL